MSKKSGNIVRRTAAELRAMERRGEVRTDWKAAAKKPLPSGRDPDDAMDEIDWLTTELPKPPRKGHMTLRIDTDVLDWFRAHGKGYQSRINAILRRYFEQHTR
ncbi:MAG: BrnA antitoxin family protein [Xanthobacteraceae bacterium]|jgi:uncharacterized protein (DUF4415 family)